MSECFPERKSSGGRVKVDFSYCAKKADLKNAKDVDTSKFAKKIDLANLKSYVHKLDIDKYKNAPKNLSNLKIKVDKLYVDKLVPIPVNLSKLSDVVKSDAIEKDVYDAKMKNIKDKIPNVTNLATNTKINEVKNGILSITNIIMLK